MNRDDGFRRARNGGPEDDGFDESFFDGELDERFADWVDGRLSDDELEALEAEMAADGELRREAQAYRDTVATVRAHLHGEAPPPDLVASVMEQLPGRRSRNVIPLLASLTAAAAIVILFVVLDGWTATTGVGEESTANIDTDKIVDPAKKLAFRQAPSNPGADRNKFAVRGESRAATEGLGKDDQPSPVTLPPGPSSLDKLVDTTRVEGKSVRRPPGTKPAAGEVDRDAAPVRAAAPNERNATRKPSKGGVDRRQRSPADTDGKSVDKALSKSESPPAGRGRGGAAPAGQVGASVATSATVRRLARLFLDQAGDLERLDFLERSKSDGPVGESASSDDDYAKKKTVSRRSRQRSGGRGGAPVTDTPVVLLSIPRSMDDGGRATKRLSGEVLGRLAAVEPKRPAEDRKAKKAAVTNDLEKKNKNVGGGAEKNRAKAEFEERAMRTVKDSLGSYFASRATVRSAQAPAAKVSRVVPNLGVLGGSEFAAKSGSVVGRTPAVDGANYAYQTGDEVYLVSGDSRQIKQLFLELKSYLGPKPAPASGALGARSTPRADPAAPSTATVTASPIPMVVQRLGAMPSRGVFRSGISTAWAVRPKADELRFLLVLRRR